MQPRAGLKETVVWSAGLRAALRRPGCCWQGLVLKPGWDVVAHSSTPAQGPHCPLQLPSLGVGTPAGRSLWVPAVPIPDGGILGAAGLALVLSGVVVHLLEQG